MLDRLLHIAVNLVCGGLLALFGGYITAGLVFLLIDSVLSSAGIAVSAAGTGIGELLLILCVLFWGIIGYFLGELLQQAIARIFF